MLGTVEKPNEANTGELLGFIGKGMTLEGKLSFANTVRIDGGFKGEIAATGTLVVGDSGVVEGEIKVGSIIVMGVVKGTLEATGRVELRAPGRVLGDITTSNLMIGDGTVFEGNCRMVRRSDNTITEVASYGSLSSGASGAEVSADK